MVAEDVREQALSYVRHNVAKGPESVREVVRKGQQQVLALIDGMTEQQAAFKPDAETWSVIEVLHHVAESHRSLARRCAMLARGEALPDIESVGGLAKEAPATLKETRTELEAAQGEMRAFVDSLSAESNTGPTLAHPWFGPMNCIEWPVFQRVHDGDHINQIEQLKSAPGYPK